MIEEQQLVDCFRHVFPVLTDPEIREASMRRLGAWDSAALLMLLARVERAFGIRFLDEEINVCTSFEAMLALVRTKRQPEASRVR
jgi:acyl carrier protein